MPSFAYLPDLPRRAYKKSDIDPSALDGRYFVQLRPDNHGLVPGMLLKQKSAPSIGKWLELGKIDRSFRKRYFVQDTDFNTLVPGSLIEGTKLPSGKWKEVKAQPSLNPFLFHHVRFTEGYQVSAPTGEAVLFTETDTLSSEVFFPVLDHYHPGLREGETVDWDLYYFKGSFDELGGDISKVQWFFDTDLAPDAFFKTLLNGSVTHGVSSVMSTPADVYVMPNVELGSYCIIMAVFNLTDPELIVLENMVRIV